ncbi:hypothetical protein GCM10023115_17080 [Pontixanthobacter gangjinensis]|nr:TadE family protein [Pontixanthobacter gangjinensis]
MAIETAIVAPILATMALGTYEVGTMVSRQHELQTAASEGQVIALAAASGATTNLATIKDIIKTSMGLTDNQITVSRFYRCNANTITTTNADSCGEDDVISSYIKIDLTDTYTPVWTDFGVGAPVTLDVERTVQLS